MRRSNSREIVFITENKTLVRLNWPLNQTPIGTMKIIHCYSERPADMTQVGPCIAQATAAVEAGMLTMRFAYTAETLKQQTVDAQKYLDILTPTDGLKCFGAYSYGGPQAAKEAAEQKAVFLTAFEPNMKDDNTTVIGSVKKLPKNSRFFLVHGERLFDFSTQAFIDSDKNPHHRESMLYVNHFFKPNQFANGDQNPVKDLETRVLKQMQMTKAIQEAPFKSIPETYFTPILLDQINNHYQNQRPSIRGYIIPPKLRLSALKLACTIEPVEAADLDTKLLKLLSWDEVKGNTDLLYYLTQGAGCQDWLQPIRTILNHFSKSKSNNPTSQNTTEVGTPTVEQALWYCAYISLIFGFINQYYCKKDPADLLFTITLIQLNYFTYTQTPDGMIAYNMLDQALDNTQDLYNKPPLPKVMTKPTLTPSQNSQTLTHTHTLGHTQSGGGGGTKPHTENNAFKPRGSY